MLRQKLYSLRLKSDESVQDHIRSMTEVFNELSVIGVELNNEDRVVHLLASLPECYSTLVTALEANAEVPIMETVIERLLHEEQERSFSGSITKDGAMMARNRRQHKRKGPKCCNCQKDMDTFNGTVLTDKNVLKNVLLPVNRKIKANSDIG